ncbi:hypothetical protein AB0I84_17675 [Streptomyces spectabilis]|uniref:hypothetical protein n=1 Tax=Streptomyces spectabilis TaxID=68270 RepID=UPI0033E6CDAE
MTYTAAELMERVEDAASLVKDDLGFGHEGPEADAIDLVVSALHERLGNPDASMADVAESQGTTLDEMRKWWHWNT